jgi:23S rRNA (cytosine1962-C5)-methyltransferase
MTDNIIYLRKDRRGELKPDHPWIYKGQILKTASSIKPGDIVRVVNSEDKFIGKGYYNPKSEISVRLLAFDDEPIDGNFFDNKIKAAAKKREHLLTKTNAYRAVFSEADSLPGLIVDIYNDTAVFQALTLGMEKFKTIIIESIKDVLNPRYIYEKSDAPHRKLEGLKEIKAWHGDKGDSIIEIFEGKAHFYVDIENGHKTGFYLDQRKSRLAMDSISKGKKVLDLFCYTGGFSVHAALSGASQVRGVDIKREWLELARKNALLNGVSKGMDFIEGDTFSILRNIYNSGETFNIIIIDPPSFVKSRHSLKSGSKGYKELNLIAMKTLNEGGILATFSCSHNMPGEAFSDILKSSARDARKTLKILKRCRQAEDHPISRSIPETEYLKGYFFRVNSA